MSNGIRMGEAHFDKQTIENLDALLKEYQDLTKALGLHSEAFKLHWKNDEQSRTKILEEFRMWRMAVTAEQSKLIQGCADVRKFFLGVDHDKEMARLREFLELAERLQKLQQSGFLEKMADTLIKLA